MTYNLFIDDLRIAPEEYDLTTRSSMATIEVMKRRGCPKFISFDHDLGGEDTTRTVVYWMINTDLDWCGSFIPKDFDFIVHSANPVGAEWIHETLRTYLQFRD